MSEKIATREAYGKALVELGNQNDKVVVLDADLAGPYLFRRDIQFPAFGCLKCRFIVLRYEED